MSLHYLINLDNPNQGDAPRYLFVCSAGMLRSATAAHIFSSPPYNYNTRCAGVVNGAVQEVTHTTLKWAHKIFCMESDHKQAINTMFGYDYDHKMEVLNIPDSFNYRDPYLIKYLIEAVSFYIPIRYCPPQERL